MDGYDVCHYLALAPGLLATVLALVTLSHIAEATQRRWPRTLAERLRAWAEAVLCGGTSAALVMITTALALA